MFVAPCGGRLRRSGAGFVRKGALGRGGTGGFLRFKTLSRLGGAFRGRRGCRLLFFHGRSLPGK